MHGSIFRWSLSVTLSLVALLLLGGCGRSEQSAAQPTSPAPLSPAPTALESATPGATATPKLIRPTPDDTQVVASVTVAYLETAVAANRNAADAVEATKAAWAQTPDLTQQALTDGPRLRELWPAAPQPAAATTRLYLRSFGDGPFDPDTFWEVRLPDGQQRRLPAVEQHSIDASAQVSPDGRFLAYVTGNAKTQERTLRVLDLAQGIDTGLVVSVTDSIKRCTQPFAWSPGGQSLAVVTLRGSSLDGMARVLLYDRIATNTAPQTLVTLPYFLDLLGWQDPNHLLLSQWKPSDRPNQLLSVDRQGHVAVIAELRAARLYCASLSPDGQELIYTQPYANKHLRLSTGQQEAFPYAPEELFWVGDGRSLLISRFGTNRRIQLAGLDQIAQPDQEPSNIFVSPPYQTTYRFGIIGVSPDGRTLVACEQAPTNNPRIRVRESRTWLYSIPDQRWTPIRTNPTLTCDLVAGWSSTGGAQ